MTTLSDEEKEALKDSIKTHKHLFTLYPHEYQYLQRQIEALLQLHDYDEAELLLEQLHALLLRQGLKGSAEEIENIREHLSQTKHVHQYYSAPFLNLATSSLIEKVFHQNRQIEIAEGDYLMQYGEKTTQLFIILDGELAVWSRDKHNNKHFEHTLRTGEIVGELAFLDGTPRNADVIATKNSRLLAIPSKDVFKLFLDDPRIESSLREEANVRRIQVELKKNDALTHLPNHLQRIIAEKGQFIHHKSLERIHQSEQPIESIELICEGYLRLVGETDDGSSIILNSLKTGSLIGCSALIINMNDNYSADVVCISDVTLVRFPLSLFVKMMEINPRLHHALQKQAELERGSLLHTIFNGTRP